MTVTYQLFYMLFVQLMASAVSILFISVAFWWFVDKPVWKEVLSCVFIIVNGGFIYTFAHKFAIQDCKPYTSLKKSLPKGAMLGTVISASTLLLFFIYKAVWSAFGTGGSLTNWFAICINMIFSVWTFPYFGIMGMSQGHITWYSVALFIAMPPAAAFIGYYAGTKKFFFIEAVDRFSYEKDGTGKKKRAGK